MKCLFAVVALCAATAMPAVAAERGFYVGFDLGQSAYDLDQNGIDQDLTDTLAGGGLTVLDGTSDTSEDGFTYDLAVGYQIWRFLAVEAAYVDLGDAEYTANVLANDGTSSGDVNAKLTTDSAGPTLSALGILPIAAGWEVYGRAGVYFASNDVTTRLSTATSTGSIDDSSNSQEFLWGVGLGFAMGEYTTRLEYQQFVDVGDDTTGEVSVDRIVLGAIYRF